MSIKDVLSRSIGMLGKDAIEMPTLASQYSAGDVKYWIPSGIVPLDAATGGGLATGRITELFSRQEGEGKSSLAMCYVAQCQKAGGWAVWLEAENSMDKNRAKVIGVDLDRLIIYAPPTVEEGFFFISKILISIGLDDECRSRPGVVVWDTIAASPIKAEKEKKEKNDEFSEGLCKKPRVIAEAFRRLVNEYQRHNAHFLILNQTYTQFKQYGPAFITSGGKSIKFYASLRIELYRKDILEDADDHTLGIRTHFTIVKNKLAPFNRKGLLTITTKSGYSNVLSMADFFLSNENYDGMLRRGGGYYYFPTDNGEGKCRWEDIEKAVGDSPSTLSKWSAEFYRMCPLLPDRSFDANGWVVNTKFVVQSQK
jgi:recombination protein RecA